MEEGGTTDVAPIINAGREGARVVPAACGERPWLPQAAAFVAFDPKQFIHHGQDSQSTTTSLPIATPRS